MAFCFIDMSEALVESYAGTPPENGNTRASDYDRRYGKTKWPYLRRLC